MFYQQRDYSGGGNGYQVQNDYCLTLSKKEVVVDAAIFACNAWVVFEGNYHQTTRLWANLVLHHSKPSWKLGTESILEVIVGYPLHKRRTRANMYGLLQFIMQREGREQKDYHIQFIPVEIEVSMMEVWCLTAVRKNL